jgi:hypothetical protein
MALRSVPPSADRAGCTKETPRQKAGRSGVLQGGEMCIGVRGFAENRLIKPNQDRYGPLLTA